MSYLNALKRIQKNISSKAEQPKKVESTIDPRGFLEAPQTRQVALEQSTGGQEYAPLNISQNTVEELINVRNRVRQTIRQQSQDLLSSGQETGVSSAIQSLRKGLFSRDEEDKSDKGLLPKDREVSEDTPPPLRQDSITLQDIYVDPEEFDVPEEVDIKALAQAVKDVESGGGNYKIRGPKIQKGRYKGERAMGAYQVMPGNLPQWSRMALGREVSVDEFMSDESIQDAIFIDQMSRSLKKYGTVEDAVSVWFTGQPYHKGKDRSDGFTTGEEYLKRFMNSYTKYAGVNRNA